MKRKEPVYWQYSTAAEVVNRNVWAAQVVSLRELTSHPANLFLFFESGKMVTGRQGLIALIALIALIGGSGLRHIEGLFIF